MAKTVKAGSAMVELSLNDKITKSLANVARKMKNFGRGVEEVGKYSVAMSAAVLAPIAAMTKVFADTGDALDKMSQRTKLSVEALSTLGFVAEGAGQTLQDVEKGAIRINEMLIQSAQGSQTASNAFGALGISVKDLEGLSADEQFNKIANALNAIEDPAKKTQAAILFFGPELGGKILSVAESLDELSAKAKSLGIIITKEQATKAAELTQEIGNLGFTVKALFVSIAGELQPSLQKIIKYMQELSIEVKTAVMENKKFITILTKIAAGVLAVGVSLLTLGKGITIVSNVITVFNKLKPAIEFGASALEKFNVIAGVRGKTAMQFLIGTLEATAVKFQLVAKSLISAIFGMNSFSTASKVAALNINAFNVSAVSAATGVSTLTAAMTLLGYAMVAVTVAVAGYKLGEWVGEVTGLNKAIAKLYDYVAGEDPFSDTEYETKELARYKKMLDDGKISIEEYKKRLKSLEYAMKSTSSKNRDEKAAKEKKAAEELARANKIAADQAKIAGDIESQKLATERDLLKIYYEGVELKRQQLYLDEEIALEKARENDNSEELVAAIKSRYDVALKLLDVEQKRIKDADELAKNQEIAKKKAEEELAIKEKIESMNKSRSSTINDLIRDAYYEGYELEQKKLDLAKKRALVEAGSNKEAIRLVEKEYTLRGMILNNRKKETAENQFAKIEDLRLEATFKGYELEKKKLELARQRAIEEANISGESVNLINQEYDLREKILNAQNAASSANLTSQGSFSSLNSAKAFGSSSYDSQIAKNTAAQLEETKKTNKLIKQGGYTFS